MTRRSRDLALLLLLSSALAACTSGPRAEDFDPQTGIRQVRVLVYVSRDVDEPRRTALQEKLEEVIAENLAPLTVTSDTKAPYFALNVHVESPDGKTFAYAVDAAFTERVIVQRGTTRRAAYAALWHDTTLGVADENRLNEQIERTAAALARRFARGPVDHGPPRPEIVTPPPSPKHERPA